MYSSSGLDLRGRSSERKSNLPPGASPESFAAASARKHQDEFYPEGPGTQ